MRTPDGTLPINVLLAGSERMESFLWYSGGAEFQTLSPQNLGGTLAQIPTSAKLTMTTASVAEQQLANGEADGEQAGQDAKQPTEVHPMAPNRATKAMSSPSSKPKGKGIKCASGNGKGAEGETRRSKGREPEERTNRSGNSQNNQNGGTGTMMAPFLAGITPTGYGMSRGGGYCKTDEGERGYCMEGSGVDDKLGGRSKRGEGRGVAPRRLNPIVTD